MAGPSLEDEVTFLIGVDESNKVAETSFQSWDHATNPPGYDDTATPIKWGGSTPGTGATVSYFFTTASGWTESEQTAWEGGMAMWSAVANITFVEAASAATANFVITRGTDREAHATIAGTRTALEPGSTTLNTPPATGSVVSIDTNGHGRQRLPGCRDPHPHESGRPFRRLRGVRSPCADAGRS